MTPEPIDIILGTILTVTGIIWLLVATIRKARA